MFLITTPSKVAHLLSISCNCGSLLWNIASFNLLLIWHYKSIPNMLFCFTIFGMTQTHSQTIFNNYFWNASSNFWNFILYQISSTSVFVYSTPRKKKFAFAYNKLYYSTNTNKGCLICSYINAWRVFMVHSCIAFGYFGIKTTL